MHKSKIQRLNQTFAKYVYPSRCSKQEGSPVSLTEKLPSRSPRASLPLSVSVSLALSLSATAKQKETEEEKHEETVNEWTKT